jgi:competence protein ComGC
VTVLQQAEKGMKELTQTLKAQDEAFALNNEAHDTVVKQLQGQVKQQQDQVILPQAYLFLILMSARSTDGNYGASS